MEKALLATGKIRIYFTYGVRMCRMNVRHYEATTVESKPQQFNG